MLSGTSRDHTTLRRRPFVRFFACEEDLSNLSIDAALPEAVATGKEPFLIIGAIAGG
jgi:molybdopterin synthase sulfur carrier subunit